MATLKKKQAEKDSGEWESLSDQTQQQVLATFNLSQVLAFLNYPFDRSSSALCVTQCSAPRRKQMTNRLLTSY